MMFLEELQMNALPALQTILYDGWILRFADGYSNRANSINPIYQSLENINKKICNCESIFRRKGLKPTFKITPFVYPENLDELLESKGYKIIHNTSIQTLQMSNIIDIPDNDSLTNSYLEDSWFDHYCKFNKLSEENEKTYRRMLNNLIPECFFTSLVKDNEIIACGMAILENGYFGLFDITVCEKYRNKGYGTRLILDMLDTGRKNGAEKAYLQVMLDNAPALHLYEKLGFKEEYRYFYRVLTD